MYKTLKLLTKIRQIKSTEATFKILFIEITFHLEIMIKTEDLDKH